MREIATLTRTRVKICGFTRLDDALEAARLGVDAIGFVFYAKSPRGISEEKAGRIIDALPPFVTTVGLFVNAPAAMVDLALMHASVDVLQFHGDETPEECEKYHYPYIKAIRMKPGIDLYREAERFQNAKALLLDAWHPAVPGGTGERFDWARIPQDLPLPVILAGGLNPDNVRAAIEQVRPWAVDVSSGVESSKGIKDPARMAAFLREVSYGDCT